MSQRYGKIYVKVKSPEDWKKLYDMKIEEDWWLCGETGKDIFSGISGDEWWIDEEWSPEFGNGLIWLSGLGSFVKEIVQLLGKNNCIVFAQLTDINVDPFYWIYYSLGDYEFKELMYPEWPEADILSPQKWLKWAGIKISRDRMKHMFQFAGRFDFVRQQSAIKRVCGEDQRRARLFISVKDSSLWEKLKKVDLSTPIYGLTEETVSEFSNVSTTDFVIEGNWRIDYGEDWNSPLYKLVEAIRKAVGTKNCVILADCADADTSPLYKVVFVVENKINISEIDVEMSDVPIHDVENWLKLAKIKTTEKRLNYMSEFSSEKLDFARA